PRGATVQIEHLEKASVPLRVHLAPGSHRLVIIGVRGERVERTVALRAGEAQTLELEPPLLELPDLRAVEHPVTTAPALSTQRILAWVSLGTAAAASGTAIGLGVGALNARSAYEQSGSISVSDYNRALTLRTWTNITWGAAALLGGA